MFAIAVALALVGGGIQLQALNHLREPRPRAWFLRPDLFWNPGLYTSRGRRMWMLAVGCYVAAISAVIIRDAIAT